MLRCLPCILFKEQRQGELIMYNKTAVKLFISVILLFTVSCGILSEQAQEPELQSHSGMQHPHDPAFRGSFLLTRMDDMKAINMAANYLKAQGETVTFQETYIEYHDSEQTSGRIPLTDGRTIEYSGDYLEVRLYNSCPDEHDHCAECNIVYISQDGKILGRNKIPVVIPDPEEPAE
jgi:hypothetical protein